MNNSLAGLSVTESLFLPGQKGVRARRAYTQGEILFYVRGPLLNKPTKYSFELDRERHIEPITDEGGFGTGHYMNHSCDPTALVRPVPDAEPPYIEVIARRNIAPNEELTFDYATLEYETTITGMSCKCGSPLCRGVITGFRGLPEDWVKKYTDEGIIPKHLLEV